MRALAATALSLGLASAAGAEMRDEERVIGNRIVRITVFDTFEIMTVGPSEYDQTQVLSGADVELVPLAGGEDSAVLAGQQVLVAEVTGTHSCDEGDARVYWAVTLGDMPMPEASVSTCEAMAASVTGSGEVLLQGKTETWAWTPGTGWAIPVN